MPGAARLARFVVYHVHSRHKPEQDVLVREKSFNEFESLFERASIPVFDLPRIAPARIAAVLTGTALDNSLLELTAAVAERFNSATSVCWPRVMDGERAASLARKFKLEPDGPFAGHPELGGLLNDLGAQLAILGAAPAGDAAETDSGIDALVFGCDAPVLIVRQPVDPEVVFSRILHSLSGDLQEIRHLAYSFSLVAQDGSLTLMHTVEEEELHDLRDTLRVSPGVSEDSGDKLVQDLAGHAERYLKGMVAASHGESYTVSYRLAVGDVLDVIRYELAEGGYSLLVVGTHEDGKSRIGADDYRLLHHISGLPVLAL